MTKLNDALTLAQQGFCVFPLGDNSKKPRQKDVDWEEIATTDPEQIRDWWQKWPGANIGIAIGKSGLLAIDIDPDKGGRVDLLLLAPAELNTVIQVTGGGGQHYLYRQPLGVKFGNGNTLPTGIDVRGDGGYIVGPGSIHPDTGAAYEWQPGRSPADLEPLPLPFALGQFLKPKGAPEPASPVTRPAAAPTNGNVPPYARAAFNGELAALSAAAVGDRNEQLNRSSFALGQLVAVGALSQADVESELSRVALAIGLGERETAKTIKSGLAKGMQKPRQIPEPTAPSRPGTNGDGHVPEPQGAGPGEQQPATEPAPVERLTDLGNARRLVRLYGENLRYVPAWGKWFVWDKSRWVEDETGVIERLAKRVPLAIYNDAMQATEEIRPKIMKWGADSESAGKISAMITLARTEAGIPIKHKDFDAKPYLLNCKNGTVNLETGELQPHSRADLLTKRVEIDYDPAATCPLWLSFLNRVFDGNQELIDFIQRAVGYSLTGDVTEQCLFFMYGTGKNGKSVFSETLKALFGDYGQKAPTDMLMVQYGANGIKNDVARLPGARFVLAAEVEEGRRLAESQVKDLTGGDTVVARFLYQELFEFEPTHKLWMYGNHKPEIRGTDDGIWRRIKLIPFGVTIPAQERDLKLTKKLRAELAGILAWAVKGCKEWFDKGLQIPPAVDKATDAYRSEMDALSEFLEDCTIEHVSAKVKAGELHQVYQEWCKHNNETALGRRAFGNRLRERGKQSEKLSTHVYWLGLGLTTEELPGNPEREEIEI